MNTSPTPVDKSVYVERLLQAKRVMQELSEEQRLNNFDIGTFAINTDHGIVACAAGFCGLDPWFQERGFQTTYTSDGIGGVSIMPETFFGTDAPFYPSNYSVEGRVTVEDVISALDRAIKRAS